MAGFYASNDTNWDEVCADAKKNFTAAGVGRFEKPAPDARAAPSEAHESLISRKTVADVPLAGLAFILILAM